MYDWQWMTIMWSVWIIWTTVIMWCFIWMNVMIEHECDYLNMKWLRDYSGRWKWSDITWATVKYGNEMNMWMIMVYEYDSVYMLDRPTW